MDWVLIGRVSVAVLIGIVVLVLLWKGFTFTFAIGGQYIVFHEFYPLRTLFTKTDEPKVEIQ